MPRATTVAEALQLVVDLELARRPGGDGNREDTGRARELSAEDRIELVDEILASLDEPDPNIDRLWAKEAEGRLAAYRRGEIKAAPLQDVLAKCRAK